MHQKDNDVLFIKLINDTDEPHEETRRVERPSVAYFDTFLTRDELAYLRYFMSGPTPSIFLGNPIITKGDPLNLKIPCNLGPPI